MKKILILLSNIDLENQNDVITSIQIFSDESGRIIQTEEAIADFNTIEEAKSLLKKILINIRNK